MAFSATHQYDPNCKYCTSNIFVQNAIEAQNTIESDRNILNDIKQNIDSLNTELTELNSVFKQTEQLNKLQNLIATEKITLERNELKLQILESELQTREAELETCLERQDLFLKNETAIKHNKKIDIEIELCKQQISEITEQIKTIQSLTCNFGSRKPMAMSVLSLLGPMMGAPVKLINT